MNSFTDKSKILVAAISIVATLVGIIAAILINNRNPRWPAVLEPDLFKKCFHADRLNELVFVKFGYALTKLFDRVVDRRAFNTLTIQLPSAISVKAAAAQSRIHNGRLGFYIAMVALFTMLLFIATILGGL